MSAHSVLRAVAMLAPGRRVAVIADGVTHELPERPEIVPPAPDPLQVAAKQLLESDVQSRALLESVGKQFAEVFGRVDETVSALAAGQVEVVKSVTENTEALYQPVKPAYFKDGKLMHAQRVKRGSNAG